jgi:hypothetical protein
LILVLFWVLLSLVATLSRLRATPRRLGDVAAFELVATLSSVMTFIS